MKQYKLVGLIAIVLILASYFLLFIDPTASNFNNRTSKPKSSDSWISIWSTSIDEEGRMPSDRKLLRRRKSRRLL